MRPIRRLAVMASVTAAIVAACGAQTTAPTRPADGLTERERAMAAQREHTRSMLAEEKPIPERKMSQILRFEVKRRQLVAITPLKAPIVKCRADIEGFGLPADISFTQADLGDPTSSQFEFTLIDYPDKISSVRVHLTCQPNTDGTADLQLEGSVQAGQNVEYFAHVVYTQTATSATLQAIGTATSEDDDARPVADVEKDFATLREKHPADLERWLRPVLHRLQQDYLFAADPNAAWQVLAAEWPLNPSAQAKLESLLAQLNAPQWQTRHNAEKQITQLGRDGATAILHRNRTGLSLEQNARLDALLSHFQPLTPEQVRSRSINAEFLLDCEYCEDATVRRLAAAKLSKLVGRPLDLKVDAPDPDRGDVIERLRKQLVASSGAPTHP